MTPTLPNPNLLMRRIIQIATVGTPHSQDHIIYALCEDGSLWAKLSDSTDLEKWEWQLVKGIPEKEPRF
jgi:hypothetical protein